LDQDIPIDLIKKTIKESKGEKGEILSMFCGASNIQN
jgi:hypothetical protein